MTVCCGEELRRAALGRRFPGDGLAAVLAELEGGGVLGVGPGAARAVEALGLVHAQERGRAFDGDLLLEEMVAERLQSAPASRRMIVTADALLIGHGALTPSIGRQTEGDMEGGRLIDAFCLRHNKLLGFSRSDPASGFSPGGKHEAPPERGL